MWYKKGRERVRVKNTDVLCRVQKKVTLSIWGK